MSMSTSCNDCVFAEFEGNEQVGCELNRIEKLEKNGAEIIGLHDEEEDKKYFLIRGRFCNACRTEEALKDIPARKWKEHVATQNRVRCEMVVYAGPLSTKDDVWKSVQSFLAQTHKPYGIKIILHKSEAEANYLVSNLRTVEIPWEVTTVVEEDAGYNRAIDLNATECKATYMTICRAGYEYPNNYLARIEHAINQEMIRFVALLPDAYGNALFVQSKINKMLGGNKPMVVGEDEDAVIYEGILEKLQYVASNEKTNHMIKSFSELPEL